ncbi:hypothetical protein [Eggerthella sinensis]|uniref:Cohesin domain-containing protein n=1 Tax=Eggerthella sinensis TaxID=242230 RepID=A0A3N0IV19_9ACTN|nr:hypothetical protein [Eggerthella sinensis]RDB66785.1 hypothetical protein C1876_13805 [Eggerthella sinensis]RNM40526.1 hypothetical protein DMP09_13995 [Eggerthella sinensis]
MSMTMKKVLAATMGALALCLALAPGVAWGATDPDVVLTPVDGVSDVAVAIELPEGARDDVRTLRLTLEVTADDLDAVNVGFAFGDGAGASAVKEARYRVQDDGTGRLNLYLAGNDNLFESDVLALGRVTAVPADGSDGAVRVTVAVAADGLSVVNAAHTASALAATSSDPVTVEVGKGSTPNPPTPPDGSDDGNDDGNGLGNGDGDGNGNGSGAGGGTGDGAVKDLGTNTSPGAPFGMDRSLVSTGDVLVPVVGVLAALVAAAAIVLAVVVVRRRSRR